MFSEALTRDLNSAAQHSVISGQPTALSLSQDSYAISIFEDNTWVSRLGNAWPGILTIDFEKNGLPVDLAETTEPLVQFDPTGGSDVFRLILSSDTQSWALISTGDGRVERALLQ